MARTLEEQLAIQAAMTPMPGETREAYEARVAAGGEPTVYTGEYALSTPEAGASLPQPYGELGREPIWPEPGGELLEAGVGLWSLLPIAVGAVAGALGGPEVGEFAGAVAEQAVGEREMTMQPWVGNGGMMPVSGPGVPEPPRAMVAKQWKTKAFSKAVGEYWVYFFRLIDGRIMCYNGAKRSWKMWRPKKPIVLYRGKVTLAQAVKVQSLLDKMWRRVAKNTKALKMATASTRRK